MERLQFNKVGYGELNARQKEQYNFQKVSAILADYGYQTIWLTSDWQSADFIAQHIDGQTFLKVQLKGRLLFDKKYMGKEIWICFPYEGDCYLYPHDEVFHQVCEVANILGSESWKNIGTYHFPTLTTERLRILETYRLG